MNEVKRKDFLAIGPLTALMSLNHWMFANDIQPSQVVSIHQEIDNGGQIVLWYFTEPRSTP